jgi:hypothetical protein
VTAFAWLRRVRERLWLIGRSFSPPPSRHGCVLNHFSAGLRVPDREAGAPFEVCHKSRPEFRVTGKVGVVSGKAHQRDEPESLVIGDVEPYVPPDHSLVSADPIGVVRRASKHFAPPGSDVPSVLLMHASGEKWREEVVLLDSVIEGVDQAIKGVSPASPFVQRRVVSHEQNVMGLAPRPFGSPRRLGANRREVGTGRPRPDSVWVLGRSSPIESR